MGADICRLPDTARCQGREYQPSDEDDGARVRVRAVPPAAGSAISVLELLSCVTEAAAPVEAPPPRPLLAHRVAAMRPVHRSGGSLGQAVQAMGGARACGEGEARRGGGAFRVLSYNVLADCYSRHWDQPGSIHSYCAKALTRPAHRMPRLLGEVLAFAPDLVLLQEADRSWFEQYWLPAMRQRGYEGAYLKKSNPSGSEGVAAFVRSAALEIVEVRELSLAIEPSDALRPDMGAAVAALLDSQTSTRDGMQQLPTVAQLLLLREAAPASHATPSPVSQVDSEETRDCEPDVMEAAPRRHLLVANTHLYFSNPAMHVRLLQVCALLDLHNNPWLVRNARCNTLDHLRPGTTPNRRQPSYSMRCMLGPRSFPPQPRRRSSSRASFTHVLEAAIHVSTLQP
jgi:hypothetical protein